MCLNFSYRARWSTRRHDNLILVARANRLIEIPHLRVELLLNDDGIQRELALDGQRAARNLGARVVFATPMSAVRAFGTLPTCKPGGSSMATSSVC